MLFDTCQQRESSQKEVCATAVMMLLLQSSHKVHHLYSSSLLLHTLQYLFTVSRVGMTQYFSTNCKRKIREQYIEYLRMTFRKSRPKWSVCVHSSKTENKLPHIPILILLVGCNFIFATFLTMPFIYRVGNLSDHPHCLIKIEKTCQGTTRI